jgi:hypothetical protein
MTHKVIQVRTKKQYSIKNLKRDYLQAMGLP